ncbi:hypothetical protein FRC01_006048 [Tulasnella sp. 417]|nr:hypothetical protein FRC01_006048 [Tulasnella sp. 417]
MENQKPIFPNGITDMEEAKRHLAQLEASDVNPYEAGCTCKESGLCGCCTDRYIPKHARGDSSAAGSSSRPTHGSRPSISLTIPPATDGPSSPGHATTPTHARRGSRSHSRSPSRSNLHSAVEGHVIGGSPNDHHRQHALHYSPYPTSTVNGAYNQSPSSAIAASMSPSLLAPPGVDNPFAFSHDMSAPASPLSVDYDRPGSAVSVHSGRNSPFDFGNIPGTPTHPQTSLFGSADSATAEAIQAMSLTNGNSSPHSANVGPAMEQILSSSMGQSLSPITAFNAYRQTPQDMPSPISPTTPQFLSPTESSAQTSPTSYVPLQQVFDANSYAVLPTGQLDMRLAAANFNGPTQQYPDVFDDVDPNDPAGIYFDAGNRSRRGSHQSIASSHSGHGTYLQPNATFAGSAPISAATSPHMGVISDLGDLNNDMALLGQSNGPSHATCSSSTKGCTCLNLDGTLKPPGETCALDNCPCCAQRNYTESMNAIFGGNGTTATSLAGSQQPFSFPRTPAGGLGPAQPPPALTLTQPQPTDGTSLAQLFQGTLDSSSNTGQNLFGGNNTTANFGNSPAFNPKPLFDFANSAAVSDIRHSRNFSHPTNLQTVGASLSGPPSPHPRSPGQFGDGSGTGSGPASPLLHHPSSPSPNSPLMTQPSSPSMHQSTPIITFSHGRSQSSSNAGLLEPRPVHYNHAGGHGRSASASLLDPLGRSSSFPSVIVTPASPHPGSSGQRH